MRQIASFGILTTALLLGTACQGATLLAAAPRAATVSATASPTTPVADAKAPTARNGFDLFLETGGESGRDPLLDKDAAMAAVLDAQARNQKPLGGGSRAGTSGACQLDEIDLLACERGISREHARMLYKNKKYKKPDETK